MFFLYNLNVYICTLGAAIGYSSGKNNSNLKTPPIEQQPQATWEKIYIYI